MGWDFNSDTSLEALAAWEAYRELPLNTSWVGATEQDAFTAGFDAAMLPRIEKPKVQLPTTPGYYFDKDGDPWKLWAETEDTAQHWRCGDDYMDATDARGFAPFTLLRPVAEVAAEVLAEAHSAIEGSLAAPHSALAAIAAKWATK
jgi:hypothetical protein